MDDKLAIEILSISLKRIEAYISDTKAAIETDLVRLEQHRVNLVQEEEKYQSVLASIDKLTQ